MSCHNKKENGSDIEKIFIYLNNSPNEDIAIISDDVSEVLKIRKDKFKEIITKSIKDIENNYKEKYYTLTDINKYLLKIKSNMDFFSLMERIEILEDKYSIVVKENRHSETELEENSFETTLDNLVKIITGGLSENWTEVIKSLLEAIKSIGYNGLKDLKTIKSWEFDILSSNDNTIIVTLVKLQWYNIKKNRKIFFFNKYEKNIKLSFILYKIEVDKKELEKYINQEKENEINTLNILTSSPSGTSTIIGDIHILK